MCSGAQCDCQVCNLGEWRVTLQPAATGPEKGTSCGIGWEERTEYTGAEALMVLHHEINLFKVCV